MIRGAVTVIINGIKITGAIATADMMMITGAIATATSAIQYDGWIG